MAPAVVLAGETGGHLLLSPLRPHGRKAHSHCPGGQKPEEDGCRRTVGCVKLGGLGAVGALAWDLGPFGAEGGPGLGERVQILSHA